MRILVYNRTPILLLIKNALSRANLGLVSAFIFVNAFLAYIDGKSLFIILFDLSLGLLLLSVALNAFKTEFGMYIDIWEEVFSDIQRILLCDPASLSKEEREFREKYTQDNRGLTLEQRVTTIAIDTYIESHRRFEEKFTRENKLWVALTNISLVLIILSILSSIVTHI